ncbi:hypothetical protein EJB05_44406, partial [Eragrostis curvula]
MLMRKACTLTDSLVAMSDSSYDTDLAASSDSDIDPSDVEYDPDDDMMDEDDDDDGIPPFSYDVDDPCIDVGVVFPDVKQCKEAVTHHAIINNHAFRHTRSDSDKFRAVKISGPKHTCGSVNQFGDFMATDSWVAARAVEFLKDDPDMGASELQLEPKKKYKIKVPYM